MKKDKCITVDVNKVIVYFAGMILLALGIVINSKVSLGVSPIISVAYISSELTGLKFGDVSFVWYGIFVIVEMIVRICQKNKKQLILDILQLPVSLIFTRFMNLFSGYIPMFEETFSHNFLGTFAGRVMVLMIAIILTGLGAAMALNTGYIPNPGDGIVKALSDITGKGTGFVKNCFDAFCVSCTFLIGLISGKAFVGIGVGTILAMLLVGRVMWIYGKIFIKKESL